MHPTLTPREFALANLHVVRNAWPGVQDADQASVHDARVALRRIRAALLAITPNDSDEIELCRHLGRELGRVRELDVTNELLANMGIRLPAVACAVAAARRDVERDRQRAARRLIKALDAITLRPLARLSSARGVPIVIFWKDWRAALPRQLARRADVVRAKIDAAAAIYMPNRLHRVRIAVKKLRYTLEVADAAGLPIERRLLRDFSKAQELLGRMHDCHVAQRRVNQIDLSDKTVASELRLLDAVITADCAAQHSKYVVRRDELLAECGRVLTLASSRPAAWTVQLIIRALPAAGLMMAPVAAWRFGVAGAARSHA